MSDMMGEDVICYKGKTDLDAIAAWSVAHADAIDLLRRIFVPVAYASTMACRSTFSDELAALAIGLEVPDLVRELTPGEKWCDAREYMARLVCYVWNNLAECNSHCKAADYVFRIAREGSRLYADCKYARTLIVKYGKQKSTIIKEAKILHATETHFKKRKWSGMEKPPTVATQAKKSKKDEMRQIRQGQNMVRL